jgi:hypothetical protein
VAAWPYAVGLGTLVATGASAAILYAQGLDNSRREDRVEVFEPLSREMTDMTEHGKWRTSKGLRVWGRSPALADILNRHALVRRRLRFLSRDVSRLLELDEAHEKAQNRFYDAREEETKKGTPAEKLFDETDKLVKPSRDEYVASAKTLIAQADLIQRRLDAALAGKLV